MKRKLLYAGIAAAVGIAAVLVFFTQFYNTQTQQQSNPSIYLDFSYDEANSNLKSILASQNINMSHPLRFITQSDINQYCHFLSDPKKQALVQYCTSTELRDPVGFLGNINMVGSPDVPGLVIAAMQSNPMMGNYDEVKTVFGDVINETVCQCWDKEKPGGYATLSDMMDALRDFHINGKKPDSTTHSVPLSNKHFEIEITTNQDGYVWKLLVAR